MDCSSPIDPPADVAVSLQQSAPECLPPSMINGLGATSIAEPLFVETIPACCVESKIADLNSNVEASPLLEQEALQAYDEHAAVDIGKGGGEFEGADANTSQPGKTWVASGKSRFSQFRSKFGVGLKAVPWPLRERKTSSESAVHRDAGISENSSQEMRTGENYATVTDLSSPSDPSADDDDVVGVVLLEQTSSEFLVPSAGYEIVDSSNTKPITAESTPAPCLESQPAELNSSIEASPCLQQDGTQACDESAARVTPIGVGETECDGTDTLQPSKSWVASGKNRLSEFRNKMGAGLNVPWAFRKRTISSESSESVEHRNVGNSENCLAAQIHADVEERSTLEEGTLEIHDDGSPTNTLIEDDSKTSGDEKALTIKSSGLAEDDQSLRVVEESDAGTNGLLEKKTSLEKVEHCNEDASEDGPTTQECNNGTRSTKTKIGGWLGAGKGQITKVGLKVGAGFQEAAAFTSTGIRGAAASTTSRVSTLGRKIKGNLGRVSRPGKESSESSLSCSQESSESPTNNEIEAKSKEPKSEEERAAIKPNNKNLNQILFSNVSRNLASLSQPLTASDAVDLVKRALLKLEEVDEDTNGMRYPSLGQFETFNFKASRKLALLGCGGFGAVDLFEEPSGRVFAVKSMFKGRLEKVGMQESIQNERVILALTSSPFIVDFYCTWHQARTIAFCMEPLMGGELYSTYKRKGLHGSIRHATYYTACVSSGLEHLGDLRIVLRGLKPEDCVLNAQGRLKLVDMNLAKLVVNKTYTTCGTPDYFAPELIASVGHDQSVDVWCVGIMLFELLSGHPPFESAYPMQIYSKVMKGISRVNFPSAVSGAFGAAALVKSMCAKKPSDRLVANRGEWDKVRRHDFFSTFDWDAFNSLTMVAPYVPVIGADRGLNNFTVRDADRPKETAVGSYPWHEYFGPECGGCSESS